MNLVTLDDDDWITIALNKSVNPDLGFDMADPYPLTKRKILAANFQPVPMANSPKATPAQKERATLSGVSFVRSEKYGLSTFNLLVYKGVIGGKNQNGFIREDAVCFLASIFKKDRKLNLKIFIKPSSRISENISDKAWAQAHVQIGREESSTKNPSKFGFFSEIKRPDQKQLARLAELVNNAMYKEAHFVYPNSFPCKNKNKVEHRNLITLEK